jgi:dienelactone hydrolase
VRACLLLMIPLLALAACGGPVDGADTDTDTDDGPPPASADAWAAPGDHAVGVAMLTLVDTTRETPANGDQGALASRTILTEVWYPTDAGGTVDQPARDAAPSAGPFPVVVFAHGFMSSRTDHALLGATLASRGWVFVAPQFPLSSLGAPGGATLLDLTSQPGDLSFVLDALLAGTGPAAPLAGVLDGERVAFAGMSLGGTTVLLAGLDAPFRDPRVDAVIAVAPGACIVPAATFDGDEPPVLYVHGDADAMVPYAAHVLPAYEATDDPKALVTLLGGTHTGFPDATAALFDGLPNADAVGCGAAGGLIQATDPSAIAAMFPEGTAFLNEDCAAACEGELPQQTMRPTRQGLLLRAAANAFLAAEIGGDVQAARWLVDGLPRAEADVTVRAEGLLPP